MRFFTWFLFFNRTFSNFVTWNDIMNGTNIVFDRADKLFLAWIFSDIRINVILHRGDNVLSWGDILVNGGNEVIFAWNILDYWTYGGWCLINITLNRRLYIFMGWNIILNRTNYFIFCTLVHARIINNWRYLLFFTTDNVFLFRRFFYQTTYLLLFRIYFTLLTALLVFNAWFYITLFLNWRYSMILIILFWRNILINWWIIINQRRNIIFHWWLSITLTFYLIVNWRVFFINWWMFLWLTRITFFFIIILSFLCMIVT